MSPCSSRICASQSRTRAGQRSRRASQARCGRKRPARVRRGRPPQKLVHQSRPQFRRTPCRPTGARVPLWNIQSRKTVSMIRCHRCSTALANRVTPTELCWSIRCRAGWVDSECVDFDHRQRGIGEPAQPHAVAAERQSTRTDVTSSSACAVIRPFGISRARPIAADIPPSWAVTMNVLPSLMARTGGPSLIMWLHRFEVVT